jgi:tetratricopeptide (TPR) repeat protein
MGAKNDWSSLKGRVAGKWQIPLLAAALALFTATIYRTRPETPTAPFQEALAKIDDHISAGVFSLALSDLHTLTGRSDLTDSQRAQIELRMGRARYGLLSTESPPNMGLAKQVFKHFEVASPTFASPPLNSNDFVGIARLMQWQSRHDEAVKHFQRAIKLDHAEADDLRKEIYIVYRDRLEETPAELAVRLDELVSAIAAHRLDVRMWALEEKLKIADQTGSFEELETTLLKDSADFEGSDYERQFEFLQCRLLVGMRRAAEAEVRLRTLRNQLDDADEVSAGAGWLLGTILLNDESREKWNGALSFFSDVLQHHFRGQYAVASRVGQAQALARLGRHDEAIATYARAVKELLAVPDNKVVNLPALRGSLGVTAEILRQKGELRKAIEYAGLAVGLPGQETGEKTHFVQHLALMKEQLADEISAAIQTDEPGFRDTVIDARHLVEPEEALALRKSAAEHFGQLAQWEIHDEARSADFSWKAAELFARSGASQEAVGRYRDFVSHRPDDHRGPLALLRVGQLYHAGGELAAAVEAFQECCRRYPRSFDGARALVPMARTYLAMGRAKYGEAERALRMVLDDSDVFTPAAGEFVESLFLLGDVLERDERYEPAISTLQEALDRYPGDPRVPRGRFLLGGAYRKSALAMRDQSADASGALAMERIREESARRLRKARRVYRDLIVDLEFRPAAELNASQQMYLQHAYLYEADCYFETQEYGAAMGLYEEAAANLRDSARGLSAHVQMINCQVFLGKAQEARAALARAMVVVDAMPESAFATRVPPESRGEWRAYFEWLGESGLF